MRSAPPHMAAAQDPARFAALVLEALAAGQESPAAVPGGAARMARGPHERALFALRARLPQPSQYEAVSRRFLALMRLLESGSLAPLTHPGADGGSTLLHPALMDTAAQMPLTRNGSFPARRFLQSAEQRARTQYAALTWPPAVVAEEAP